MSVVIGLAAAGIVIATLLAARGYGGEMASFPRDTPEFGFHPRSSSDLLSLELPMSFFGFSQDATAVALNSVGRLLAIREAEVAYLRDELDRIAGSPGPASPGQVEGPGVPSAEGGEAEPGEVTDSLAQPGS